MGSVTGRKDQYGNVEEGQCGNSLGEAGRRSVSGDEGGECSQGNKGLNPGGGKNFKMSSSDPVSESGKQA